MLVFVYWSLDFEGRPELTQKPARKGSFWAFLGPDAYRHAAPKKSYTVCLKSQGHGSRTVASECGLSWAVRHKPEKVRISPDRLPNNTRSICHRAFATGVIALGAHATGDSERLVRRILLQRVVCSKSYETFWWIPGASKIIGKHCETFRAWSDLIQRHWRNSTSGFRYSTFDFRSKRHQRFQAISNGPKS